MEWRAMYCCEVAKMKVTGENIGYLIINAKFILSHILMRVNLNQYLLRCKLLNVIKHIEHI